MNKKQLLVIGQINIDTLIFGDEQICVTPGGAGTHVAMAASTVPQVETNLLATLCPDMPETFLQDLHRNKINTENILMLLGQQRRSQLEYSEEFHRNNTGMLMDSWKFLTNEQTPRHMPLRHIRYDALHLPPQPAYNQRLYAQWGHESGMLVSLDTCERYAESDADDLRNTLGFVDIFMPSEIELYAMYPECGENLDAIAAHICGLGVKILVVKCAEEGSRIYDFGRHLRHDVGILDVQVLDATGAGDSYNGGFLACYLATGDVAFSAKYGACVAAVCIQKLGYRALCGKTSSEILPFIEQVNCITSPLT